MKRWGRKRYVAPWRRDEEETGKEKVEIIVEIIGLKEERKSIAFISYIVNLVSGSNDS